MGFKAINRARLIADEEKEIVSSVARSISALNRDLLRVQNFAAFAFNSVVAEDGDVDADDLTDIIAEFQSQRALIDALIPMLDSVEGINDKVTPANIPTNLATFIADNNINLSAYSERFK